MQSTLENTNGNMSRFTAHGFRVFFASVLVFSAFCSVHGNSCPEGWTFFEGFCYFFSNQTATWVNAREHCKEIGGDLVKVSSDSQNAFIASHYSSFSCLSQGAWIGLHRNPRNTSRWIWLDELDEELIYTKWHRKETINDRLDKNCTEIQPTKSIYWFGRECSAQGCYICIKDANECNNYNICTGQPCLDIVGSYQCSRGAGYLTTEQEKECEDIDECKDKNGGCPHVCVNTQGSFLCHCRDGYVTERNGTVCGPPYPTPKTKIKSGIKSIATSTSETNDTYVSTEPPHEQPTDQLIEEPKKSPLTSGVLFTMAIPLCFIVCFLVLCYIKGPGKEKNKEGISERLIESVSPFLDTAFIDPKEKNGERKSKRKSVTTKNSTFSEEEPMV